MECVYFLLSKNNARRKCIHPLVDFHSEHDCIGTAFLVALCSVDFHCQHYYAYDVISCFFVLFFSAFSLSLTIFCLHLFHYFHCFFTNASQCWTLYLYRLMLNNTLWEQTIKWATSYVNLMLVCDFGVRVVLLSASTISHQIYSIFATGAGNHLHYSFNWHAVALRLFVSYFGTCFFSFSFSAWLSRSISLWNERK